MQVNLSYHDDTSFTVEEVVKLAQHNYGKNVQVKASADSLAPHDQIYFALWQMITARQMVAFYDDKHTYQNELRDLRAETLVKLQEILDSVIIDNESKVA